MTQTEELLVSRTNLLAAFKLRESRYALDAAMVFEVIRVAEISPVPHAPAEVVGVINLRGRIVTLIDIGLILGFAPATITRQSRIFIIEDRGEYTGLLADQVSEVTEVSDLDLQAPPANIPQEQLKFCRNVYRASSHVVLLLDTTALLESVGAGSVSQ